MQKRPFLVATLAAALVAAVCAHTAIDILGDYLVRDDAYDHVAHASRTIMAVAALLIGSGVLIHLFARLCSNIRARRIRTRILAASKRTFAAASATVVVASLVMVPAMEYFDAVRAGSDLDDLGDLFGGSLALGLSTTLVIAGLIAGLLIAVVRWICAHQDQIVEALTTLLCAFTAPAGSHVSDSHHTPIDLRRTVLLRRHRKRGPPTRFASAIP